MFITFLFPSVSTHMCESNNMPGMEYASILSSSNYSEHNFVALESSLTI